MRTTDALIIGMELGRIRGALDAWEESKHPRADNGQFTSGAGGGGKSATFKEATKRRSQTKAKENEAAVSKAKKTLSDIDKKIAQAKKDGDQKRVSFLEATKKRAEKTSGKPTKEEINAFIAKVTGKEPYYGISPEDEKKIKTTKYRVDHGQAAPEDLQIVARQILEKRKK